MSGNAALCGEERGPFAILSGDESDPSVLFDQTFMRGVTPAARRVHASVVAAYHDARHATVLQPGDGLFVDNARCVHGRSSFTPAGDGLDRWLVRSFVVRDLVAGRAARPGGGRIVAAASS